MYDLIVIGAGLSGLQAAYTAKQAGLSVAVLEARDRVGGKVWSIPLASGKGVADLGAAWVNDTLQPRIWSYIQQFGLKTTAQPIDGVAIMQIGERERLEFPFGIVPDFPEDEKRNLIRIRDHIEELSLKKEALRPEHDRVSLDQYVRDLGATKTTAKMVNIWAQAMHGVESTEESAAYFVDYCRSNHGLLAVRADDKTGGNYLRLQGGTTEIVQGLAKLFGRKNLFLSTPVSSINDLKTKVIVRSKNGKEFVGRKCILSIPSTMYRELSFTPTLPPRLREMTNATRLGHYNKAIVYYSKRWWRDLGYNGFAFSYTGPVCIVRDSSVPERNLYAFTCFVNGRAGEEWSNLDASSRRDAVLKQLAAIYKINIQERTADVWNPIEYIDQIWQHEQFSRGALAPIPALGHFTEFADVYGKPVGNLHFVGTEYSDHWRGYMEGALTSGDKGAREVIGAFGGRSWANL
ncbi:hypothetical protein BDW74DRAFT_174099 [Aspergillus multicolor]|uniref:flavin monoamine oxidase family protein n=1 Tax=Aspergillus multicolor TaxID=41759 RepID=UPI003CCE4AB3